jgi:OmpA-OmpF porin, OOP family
MKTLLLSSLISGLCFLNIQAQDIQEFKKYDFVPGEKILFEDNLSNSTPKTSPALWNVTGGKATIEHEDNDKYISINEYYTALSPKLINTKVLPDVFTIEYDTWLDAGYDGNPGIEIHLKKADQELLITPNKHNLTVSYPNDGKADAENPAAYFGENKFYNRWVHISISYNNKKMMVYLDQYKLINIDNCQIKPDLIVVTGNTSENMKILFKNFKLATGIPNGFTLDNGKFITHAIKFDVNKAVVKPESMSTINEIVKYLNANVSVKLEIGGHTDSDGSDDSNLKLSDERAAAVKNLLVSLGIADDRLTSKGYGEAKPIDSNTTAEGKANNRRVEFVKQ